jgi:broad specificity phosphatase PhoE
VTGALVLVRHGEIIRPADTSNFNHAALSDQGKEQIRELARAWPADRPTAIFASPLRRSRESAAVLAEEFRGSLMERTCLREWSPDDSGIPQADYKTIERTCWRDLEFVPPSGESLVAAEARGRRCLDEIARGLKGATAAVVGHGTLFSLVTARLKGDAPTESYKNSIGFGHAAILTAGSALRLVRDFSAYESGSR